MYALVLACGLLASIVPVQSAQSGESRERAAALARSAEEHATAGRLAEAIRVMEEAERAAPRWAELKVNIAALKSQAEDFGGAIAAARAALAIDPTLDGAWLNLGLAQLKSGDAAGAVQALDRFKNRRDAPGVAIAALGLALFATGRDAESETLLQRAVDGGLRNADVLIALGRARLRLDDIDGAEKAIQSLTAENSRSASVLMLQGDIADARHDWAAAESAYRDAIAADPQVPHGHYSLGLTLYKQRRYDEAAQALDRALTAAADYPPALRYRAELELDRGDAEAALPHVLRLTEIAPRNADGWKLLGRAKLDRQRVDDAIAALERARELVPRDPTVHFLLGRAFTAAGRAADATAAFEQAATLNQQLRDELEKRVTGKKRDGGG
jgi:superkiller protein 3